MSIELHIYSEEPVLFREKLTSECLWPELPPKLQWHVRFLSEADELLTIGPLSDGLIFGWHPEASMDSQIQEAFITGNQARLDALSIENRIGSLSLSVLTSADEEEWANVIESVKEDTEDPTHRKYLRKVRTFYSLETSATRNDLSLEFQEQLWRMIGVLCHGLMYDPQEGRFDLFQELPDTESLS